MKKIYKRLRPNGETNLFHTREDIKQLMDYCNFLADKINELIDENDRLKQKIERVASATWHE